MNAKAKIGLFCIGLDTYWPQFDGLLERLTGYHCRVRDQLQRFGAEVIDAGMVDTVDKAHHAAAQFAHGNIDMIILFVSTYALSHTVLPVVQRCRVPVLVLNLQPVPVLDYQKINAMGDRGQMTGEWLAHCQACVMPELASVFNRAGINYQLVTGYLDEAGAWWEIGEWIQAAEVKKAMAENRVGVVGRYYNGMLDVYSDLTQQAAAFGNHFELIEFGVVRQFREQVTAQKIKDKVAQFNREFAVSPDCSAEELERAAKTSAALDKMVEQYRLGSLAYYYEGVGDPVYEDIITSVIPGFTLLTGHHVPVAGECEVKNAQAMKIMDLFDAGGSFSEFYAIDFHDDALLLGHDGPAHFAIAEGKVKLVPLPLYHGKPGKGLSIQMKVKNGPITVLSVLQARDGAVRLLVAEGESVPGPTLEIGNTNSRYRFPIDCREFVNRWSAAGPSHHCAVGVGHLASKIAKLGRLLGMEAIRIC